MNEKTKKFLDAQEYPEQFTDEELFQMQDDPEIRALMEAAAQGKRALMKQKCEESQESIDAAWQDFDAKHFTKSSEQQSLFHLHLSLQKAAAFFIGLLFISGLAIASVHFVRNHGNKSAMVEPQSPNVESQISEIHKQSSDTIVSMSPVVFDNLPLDSILSQIAKHYSYNVSFCSDKSKSLRLFFTWNMQDSIQAVVEKLNLFEQIHITLNEQTIIVE